MDHSSSVRADRDDSKARFRGERDGLLDQLTSEPGAAQLRRDFDVLDAHHADFGPRELEEPKALAIDASLARRALGFESRLDAPQAVALTMDWYARQAAGQDPLGLCVEQIEGYEARK